MAPNPLLQLAEKALEKFGNRSPQAAFYRATAQEAAIKGWRQSKMDHIKEDSEITIVDTDYSVVNLVTLTTKPNGKLHIVMTFSGLFDGEGGGLTVRLKLDDAFLNGAGCGVISWPTGFFNGSVCYETDFLPAGQHRVYTMAALQSDSSPNFRMSPLQNPGYESACLVVAEVSF